MKSRSQPWFTEARLGADQIGLIDSIRLDPDEPSSVGPAVPIALPFSAASLFCTPSVVQL